MYANKALMCHSPFVASMNDQTRWKQYARIEAVLIYSVTTIHCITIILLYIVHVIVC